MSYIPDPLYDDTELGRYLSRELQKISDQTTVNQVDGIEFKVWNVLPDKPRAGQVYYADGTQWNPGSGEGLYRYSTGGSWVLLG